MKIILTFVKVAGVIVLSFVILTGMSLWELFWFLVLAGIAVFAGNKKTIIMSRLRYAAYVCVSVFVFQLLFNTGVAVSGRVFSALTTSMRLLDITLVILVFTSYTTPLELMKFLGWLPSWLRLMVVMTFAMIPAVFGLTEQTLLVQKSRGSSFGLANLYRSVPAVLVPVLHGIFRHAEQTAFSVISRGYE